MEQRPFSLRFFRVCSAAAAEKERDAEGPIREGWSHPILRATLEIETM